MGLGLKANFLFYIEMCFLSLEGRRVVQGCVCVCVCTHIPVKKLNRLYDSFLIIMIYNGKNRKISQMKSYLVGVP